VVWVQNDDLELIEKMSHLLLAPAVVIHFYLSQNMRLNSTIEKEEAKMK